MPPHFVVMGVPRSGTSALAQALSQGAAAVVLTPRALNPTGGSWTRERVAEIAAELWVPGLARVCRLRERVSGAGIERLAARGSGDD